MSWDKITPGAPLASGFQSFFGNQLVEPPLQGPFGESEFAVRQQVFDRRAVHPRRDDAEQVVEFLNWNLKWHDFRTRWHDCMKIAPDPAFLWHDSINRATKIKKDRESCHFRSFWKP